MKDYPESVKRIQKMFDVPDEAVIEVKVPAGVTRVCDYCNETLIDGEGAVLAKCHVTDYGLMCDKCVGDIKPYASYEPGANVLYESWYQNGIE